MASDKKQLRLTIPSWIVKLKSWENSHLELVVVNIRDDNKPIDNNSVFVVKEVLNK